MLQSSLLATTAVPGNFAGIWFWIQRKMPQWNSICETWGYILNSLNACGETQQWNTPTAGDRLNLTKILLSANAVKLDDVSLQLKCSDSHSNETGNQTNQESMERSVMQWMTQQKSTVLLGEAPQQLRGF